MADVVNPILFLDIDGVLNGNEHWKSGVAGCQIHAPCVEAFNFLLEKAKPQIVLSSTWRYLILHKNMTLRGFEYMLHSHGVRPIVNQIIGTTLFDEQCPECEHKSKKRIPDAEGNHKCPKCEISTSRGLQISHWLRQNPGADCYLVLDDIDFGISHHSHRFIQTKPSVGLTMRNARKAVKLLTQR